MRLPSPFPSLTLFTLPRPALLLAAWLAAGAALAQPTPQAAPPAALPRLPPAFVPRVPAAPADQQAELERLAPLALACEASGPYHAYRGALLLALRQPEEAAVALEKSLLLDPEQPGAQLDYAQALAQAGHKSAARALVHDVLRRPDLPPGLRDKLAQGAQDLAPSWRWGGHLQASMGFESNINNASSADTLTLLLPNGPVTLTLADTERAQARQGLKTLAAVQGAHQLGPGEVRLNAALSERKVGGYEPADTRLLDAGAGYALALGPGTLSLALGQQDLSIGRQPAYASQSTQLRYELGASPWGCAWAPLLGQALQKYPASPVLDGSYRFARLEATCPGGASARTQLAVASGFDTPQDATRPGGTRLRQEALLRHDRLAGPGQLSLWARWNLTQDSDAFSPLLGDLKSATRTVWLGAGYWWPLAPRWSYGVDIESTAQNSNNALFNMNNFMVYGGVRWSVE